MPGALNRKQVRRLHRLGLLKLPRGGSKQIGACSIDLSLSNTAFLMEHGSTKPSVDAAYEKQLRTLGKRLRPQNGHFCLERKGTYVFKLREELTKKLGQIGIHGQATAKSSVGRLDVLARLIVDGMDMYECFDANKLAKKNWGKMYLEITPNTFGIEVKKGLSLAQLRLFYGHPKDSEVTGKEICRTVLGFGSEPVLTLDLTPEPIGGIDVCAFRAKTGKKRLLAIERGNIDPCKYWSFVKKRNDERIHVESEEFYILRSREKLYVPTGIAIYCKAIDETIGEMRIHYAGFVHPGFGTKAGKSSRGTHLIFEVRGHQVNANLKHGEKMATLVFFRMSRPDRDESPYDKQTLKLSKYFAEWPKRLKSDKDGNVKSR